MRTAFDLTPYRRSTVGFDRLFDALENSFRAETQDSYPPFDIVRTGEDSYRINIAVAGFRPDEIDITAQQNQLVISGQKTEKDEEGVEYVHRGIAARAFERRFQLATPHLVDFWMVVGNETLARIDDVAHVEY